MCSRITSYLMFPTFQIFVSLMTPQAKAVHWLGLVKSFESSTEAMNKLTDPTLVQLLVNKTIKMNQNGDRWLSIAQHGDEAHFCINKDQKDTKCTFIVNKNASNNSQIDFYWHMNRTMVMAAIPGVHPPFRITRDSESYPRTVRHVDRVRREREPLNLA